MLVFEANDPDHCNTHLGPIRAESKTKQTSQQKARGQAGGCRRCGAGGGRSGGRGRKVQTSATEQARRPWEVTRGVTARRLKVTLLHCVFESR